MIAAHNISNVVQNDFLYSDFLNNTATNDFALWLGDEVKFVQSFFGLDFLHDCNKRVGNNYRQKCALIEQSVDAKKKCNDKIQHVEKGERVGKHYLRYAFGFFAVVVDKAFVYATCDLFVGQSLFDARAKTSNRRKIVRKFGFFLFFGFFVFGCDRIARRCYRRLVERHIV